MNCPKVSIVIAAKNAEATLDKCLRSVFAQHYPNFEVMVVDDGSRDRTGAVAGSYPGVKLLRTKGVGPSRARNLAAREASGAFIAFTDADCLVAPDWLDELLKGFGDDAIAGVGGHQESPADETAFGRKVQKFFLRVGVLTGYMQRVRKLQEVPHNASCNVIYRKSAYEALGGFLEGFWPGEDLEFDHRLRKKKYKLMMTPKAAVYHYRVKTFRGLRDMMFRYGWAQGRLLRLHGFFRFVHWIPFLTLGALMLWAVAALFQPALAWILPAVLLLGLSISASFDPTLLVISGLAFVFWNAGFLKGIFFEMPEAAP